MTMNKVKITNRRSAISFDEGTYVLDAAKSLVLKSRPFATTTTWFLTPPVAFAVEARSATDGQDRDRV
jgi:hypothetical protein